MNSAPSANSQTSGSAPVSQVLPKLTTKAPTTGPISVPRPPTATQITASIELPGENSLGIDDADLRHVERAGDARHGGRQDEDEELVVLDAVAEEARAAFGVAHRDQHLAEARADDRRPQITRKIASASAEAKHSTARVAVGLHGEAQDVLEVGQAVVAAEAHVVAEEGEQQRDRSSPG